MRRSGRWVRILVSALVLAGWAAAGIAAEGSSEPVRVGIVPSRNVKALVEQYQPLMDYLSAKAGRPFELRPAKTYGEIVEKLKAGEIDGGIFGSFVAEQTIREIGAVPVARAERNGVSVYRGFVIVRKDSGIRSIGEMKGKTFDFVDTSTSAGYVFPRALLKRQGHDPEAFFSRVTFAGKHDVALSKVLNKESDGAAVKDTVFDGMAERDPRVAAELTVIHKSEGFPDGTILFRKETPADLVRSLRQALLGAEADPAAREMLGKVGADRYIETQLSNFAYLTRLRKELGE